MAVTRIVKLCITEWEYNRMNKILDKLTELGYDISMIDHITKFSLCYYVEFVGGNWIELDWDLSGITNKSKDIK